MEDGRSSNESYTTGVQWFLEPHYTGMTRRGYVVLSGGGGAVIVMMMLFPLGQIKWRKYYAFFAIRFTRLPLLCAQQLADILQDYFIQREGLLPHSRGLLLVLVLLFLPRMLPFLLLLLYFSHAIVVAFRKCACIYIPSVSLILLLLRLLTTAQKLQVWIILWPHGAYVAIVEGCRNVCVFNVTRELLQLYTKPH